MELTRNILRWSRLLLLAAITGVAVPAQAAVLQGALQASDTNAPIANAVVRLVETGRATRSDDGGQFRFDALPAGRYTLSIHHLAFADLEREVVVTDTASTPLTVVLRPAVYLAEEILVRSSRSLASMRRTPYAVDARSGETQRTEWQVTAPEALASAPGVTLVRDGTWETALSIRGMSRSSIVALVDHTRLETATDISGGLSLIDGQDLERVEVVKSAGSVLFGSGALGGAVHLVSRRAAFRETPHWAGEWTSGATSADAGRAQHLAFEHSARRLALRVSGGQRRASDTRTPVGPLANSRYSDWSLAGSVGVRTFGEQSALLSYQRVQAEDTGIPGGSPIAATAIARYPMARRERVALEYTFPNLTARLPLLTARLAHQVIAREVEILQTPTVTVTPHAVHRTVSGQLEARMVPGRGHSLVVGLDGWERDLDSRRERWLKSTARIVGERPVPRAQYRSIGLYAQEEWSTARDRVRVVLGARGDQGRSHNGTTLNPEYVISGGVLQPNPPGQVVLWPERTTHDASWDMDAGLHAQVTPHLAASLLVASAYRSPSLEERFQFIDLGSVVRIGDPALRPERSVSTNAGLRWRSDALSLRADLFRNALSDLVAEVPATWESRPALRKTNIGQARIHGLELEGEQHLGRDAALSASLAWVEGEDTGSDVPLPQIAPWTGRIELRTEWPRAGTVRVAGLAMRRQDRPAPGETATAGATVWDVGFVSRAWGAGASTLSFSAGLHNVFDRAYQQHLSTLRGTVRLEPGRNAYVMLQWRMP